MVVIWRFRCLSAFLSLSTMVASQARAGEDSSFSLYAYGKSIGGLPVVFYEDLAYVSNNTASLPGPYVNITFQVTSGNSTAEVIPVSGTFNETKYVAIKPSDGAYEQVRIIHSPASGETIAGFRLFGQDLVRTDGGEMTGNWYVTQETDDPNLYALKWNSGLVNDGYSKPVGLRAVPPTS